VAGLTEGFAVAGSENAWTLLAATTSWAQLPVAIALLGTALLAWYHNEHWCDDLETYLRRDESSQAGVEDAEFSATIDQAMSVLLKRVNRSRLAVFCIAILAVATALAAVATLVGVLHSPQGYFGTSSWSVYVTYVAEVLSIVVPTLGAAVLTVRAWARGTYLLRVDEVDWTASENEPAAQDS
jgi:hypothetical protein